MKAHQALFIVLPLLLCQCKTASPAAGTPAAAVHPHSDLFAVVREDGLKDGRRDRAQGKSPSYGRHVDHFDERSENVYMEAYEKGYMQ